MRPNKHTGVNTESCTLYSMFILLCSQHTVQCTYGGGGEGRTNTETWHACPIKTTTDRGKSASYQSEFDETELSWTPITRSEMLLVFWFPFSSAKLFFSFSVRSPKKLWQYRYMSAHRKRKQPGCDRVWGLFSSPKEKGLQRAKKQNSNKK